MHNALGTSFSAKHLARGRHDGPADFKKFVIIQRGSNVAEISSTLLASSIRVLTAQIDKTSGKHEEARDFIVYWTTIYGRLQYV